MGQSDLPLTPRGRTQAEAVAQAIAARERVKALYASPLTRARETAEALSGALGLPVRPVDGLAELDIGPLEGLTSAERLERYPEFSGQWERNAAKAVLPGVESLAHLQERTWRAVRQIADAHQDGETVVAVSHSLAITMLLCKVLELHIDKFRYFQVDLTSISIVQLRDNRTRLLSLNNLSHLAEDLLLAPGGKIEAPDDR
jgi:probable phosphoglycerate mutase